MAADPRARWDLSLFSSVAGPGEPEAYLGAGLIILVQAVLIVVLVLRRRHVEPEPTPGRAPA